MSKAEGQPKQDALVRRILVHLRQSPRYEDQNFVERVSTPVPYEWTDGQGRWPNFPKAESYE